MSDGLASFSKTSYSYDELVAGETITTSAIITGVQGVLIRGTVMGRDAATGKWARATAPAAGILVHDVDTTAGDVGGIIHVQGKFKDNVIIPPAGKTVPETRRELWDSGIYLLDVQE